jgi:DNA-binding transcriptional LysR family regulator
MPRPVTHLANLDLNLLVALRELVQERSVTRAAERLGVTQPAASAALSRLRRHFGDDILVRERGEYVLTALGAQLAEQVDTVCAGAERVFAASTQFDPATSEREFTLVMADYTIMVMGEALSQAVSRVAPGVRLHVRLVRESLSTEYADGIRFVDGVVAPATHGFTLPATRCAELFADRWVCLVDADNPVLDAGRLRLADLARLPWVAPYYRANPNPPAVPVMRQLALLGIQPRIAIRLESYLSVPYFIAGTDRIALMQERLATRLAAQMNLKVVECPGAPEPIIEALWWHRQYEDDTAHTWFRRLIVTAARATPRLRPNGPRPPAALAGMSPPCTPTTRHSWSTGAPRRRCPRTRPQSRLPRRNCCASSTPLADSPTPRLPTSPKMPSGKPAATTAPPW